MMMNKIIPQQSLFNETDTPAIYGIFHIQSGRVYVGSAINLQNRWRRHRWELRSNRHNNQRLQRAWIKYGAEAFEFRIIEFVSPNNLIAREQFWMDKTNCVNQAKGFNILPKAHSGIGFRHTPETIARIKETKRNNPQVLSAESRRKISEAGRRRVIKDSTRAKLSASHLGFRHTQASREKMSKIHKGRAVGVNANNAKLNESQVLEIKLLLAQGVKQSIICQQFGMPSPCISDILHGKRYSNTKASGEIEDAVAGRISSGYYAKNRNRMLTMDQVRDIKNRAAQGESCASIARDIGMSRCGVSRIKRGVAYVEITSATP